MKETQNRQGLTVIGTTTDIRIENHGSIYLFRPLTRAALDWMEQHCPADGEHQYFGNALVVEPRYVEDLMNYAVNDGLSL